MARVTISDKWTADGDVKSVRRRVLDFLDAYGMAVVDDENGRIDVKQGSQLRTRLLGGWFVNARHLPKRATIVLRDVEDRVGIRATIEESLGFGLIDPRLEDKYEKFFNNWLDDLRDAVR